MSLLFVNMSSVCNHLPTKSVNQQFTPCLSGLLMPHKHWLNKAFGLLYCLVVKLFYRFSNSVGSKCCCFSVIVIIINIYSKTVFIFYLGAMQTPEAGADSTSTVPLQTTVPVQPTGSTQQVPVQQQVHPACLCVCVCMYFCLNVPPQVHIPAFPSVFLNAMCDFTQLNNSFSTLVICFARLRLFNRFNMFTQHRCSMWKKTVVSTPTATCESVCYSSLSLHKY